MSQYLPDKLLCLIVIFNEMTSIRQAITLARHPKHLKVFKTNPYYSKITDFKIFDNKSGRR